MLEKQAVNQIPGRPALMGLQNRIGEQSPVIHIPAGRSDFLPVNGKEDGQEYQPPAEIPPLEMCPGIPPRVIVITIAWAVLPRLVNTLFMHPNRLGERMVNATRIGLQG